MTKRCGDEGGGGDEGEVVTKGVTGRIKAGRKKG